MDPNTPYYYALSTIAQCAAALTALLGFLGMWRLDRLRDEERRAEDEVIAETLQFSNIGPDSIPYRGRAYFLQKARELVAEPTRAEAYASLGGGQAMDEPKVQRINATLRPRLETYNAVRRMQRPLLWVLRGFLVVILTILGVAVVGFRYVDQVTTWAWTPTLLWIAGVLLAGGPIVVVWMAARVPRALVTLPLLLALTTPALAGPVRCTTYEERTLNHLQTLCDDGTRATSYWNRTLSRWETTITPPPGQTCTGGLNPRTRQWEGRCR
jgi:hypothetical protein